jgi:hypothetical protein
MEEQTSYIGGIMKKLFIILAIFSISVVIMGCAQKPPVPPPGTAAAPGAPAAPAAPGQTGTVNVATPQGNVAISGQAGVTEAQMGVPFYPNAVVGEGGGGTVTSRSAKPGEGGTISAVSLTTKDPIANVISFYTGKLGAPSFDMNTADGRSAMWTVESADKKGGIIVTVATEKDKPGIVTIAILRTAGQ